MMMFHVDEKIKLTLSALHQIKTLNFSVSHTYYWAYFFLHSRMTITAMNTNKRAMKVPPIDPTSVEV